jgi:hypothetical protein
MTWRVEWTTVTGGEPSNVMHFAIVYVVIILEGYMICGFYVIGEEDWLVFCACFSFMCEGERSSVHYQMAALL